MQNVTYSEKLKQVPTLYHLAEKASTYLDDVISRRFTPLVSAAWDGAQDDRGQPIVTLSLKEEGDEVTARFDPKVLADDREMKSHLRDLWDDLLKIQIHKHFDKLSQIRATVED